MKKTPADDEKTSFLLKTPIDKSISFLLKNIYKNGNQMATQYSKE